MQTLLDPLKFFSFLLLATLSASASAAPKAELCAVGSAGQQVCLEQPAKRIVSLSPHITELLFAAGAGDYVVGAMAHSDYPEPAQNIPRVGDYQTVSLEKILSLNPDLVVYWPSGNPPWVVGRFADFNIPVLASDPAELDDVAADIRALGVIADTLPTAEHAIRQMRVQRDRLQARYGDKRTVKTLLVISAHPLMGLSDAHAVAEAFRLCGADNVLSDTRIVAPMLGPEGLLKLNPELVISTVPARSVAGQWAGLKRVFDPQLSEIDGDLILRQTPRMLDGIEVFCQLIDQTRHAP